MAEGVDVPVISVRALAGDGALGGLGGGSGLFEVSKDDDVFVVEGGGGAVRSSGFGVASRYSP